MPAPETFVPRHCLWEATRRCNLSCLHCGSRAGPGRPRELDTEEAFGLIDSLQELGCRRVILSGGEPLLREDLADIALRIFERGMRPCLVSNGLILPEKIGTVLRLPLHSVAVSLDGLEETHNRLRRHPQSFQQAMESLRLLAGQFHGVYVITQVNRHNINDLQALHRLVSELGVTGWQIQLTSDMGRAEDLEGLALDRQALERLVGFILEKENGPVRIFPADDIGYHCLGRFKFNGCSGGISSIGIQADGGVKPCLSMQKDDLFLGGNIRQRPLKDIWRDPGFASINRGCRELSGRCAACDVKDACRGGCVGTALAFGSLKEYPFCVKEAV